MKHPRNKAERRRVAFKKEIHLHDREDSVQRRLAQEELETKEALDVLRRKVSTEEDE